MNIGWLQEVIYIYIYSTRTLGEQITCIDDNEDIDGI